MKKFRFFIYVILITILSSPLIGIHSSIKYEEDKPIWQNDTIFTSSSFPDSLILTDSIFFTDSVTPSLQIKDTLLVTDTIPQKREALDAQVEYSANDSIIFTAGNWGYLYGESEVYYRDLVLKAENISMNLASSIVHATYGIDSIGTEFGYPVFTDNGADYEAKSIRYNFKTKKGYSLHTITQQGEGYIVAERAKKNEDDSFFMCDGRYTTCDNHDHPHFYLMLTKAKVRPKKDIITGPAYLVIEDVPLPIGLPFAFFPFTDKYSSGVIMPSYADELERGFGLYNGGYYFAINDYIDLALTGEIYTKGSWGLAARSTYKKRYRFSGNFDISYLFTKYGDKEDPDYATSKDFKFNWTHTQDPKANMYRTLSASVNFKTSSYSRNSTEEIYRGDYTDNTKNSTVTLTQKFPNSPFTISGNISVAQIARDTTVSLTLPNVTISMSRIYPFKRKEAIGAERWYEKIQMSYTGDFRNSITTKEYDLFKSNLIKDWKNGMKHTIPVSATFNLFNYLNVTPAINYTERWYTQKITEKWNAPTRNHISADTTYSFKRIYDFNYSISLQTKLYGFYEPLFRIGKIKTIRHVFTPSISFSGNPDFTDPKWGFYESYDYYDAEGNLQTYVYSPYRRGIFGTAPSQRTGNINFSFENNLEMKVAAADDSTRIISLIDNLGIRFSYNMMADSLRWSDITTNVRLKLSKSLTVNINATFDPYIYDINDQGRAYKVDKLRISEKGTIGRLKSTSYSISPSINQDTFKKWFGRGGEDSSSSPSGDPPLNSPEFLDDLADEEWENRIDGERTSLFAKTGDDGEYDEDGYLRNEVKWNVSANYSFNYAYDYSDFDERRKEYRRKLTHTLGFSGSIQPTKNWNFSFTTSYDFDQSKFAYLNCSLTRNLHCWSLTASFIPIGPYKSYFVILRANSSLLQDLKYEQKGRASTFDPEWY